MKSRRVLKVSIKITSGRRYRHWLKMFRPHVGMPARVLGLRHTPHSPTPPLQLPADTHMGASSSKGSTAHTGVSAVASIGE